MFNNKRAVQDNWHKKVMEDPIVGIDVFKFFQTSWHEWTRFKWV